METLASVASDFVNGVIHYPFMSGGIFVAWGLLVGVGVLACRIRDRGRLDFRVARVGVCLHGPLA